MTTFKRRILPWTKPAVLLSALVATLMWFGMRGSGAQTDRMSDLAAAVKAQAESMERLAEAQRPGFDLMSVGPTILPGEPLRWEIRYKNYGATPALHVMTCGSLVIGANALSSIREPSLERCRQSALNPGVVASSGLVAPGSTGAFELSSRQLVPPLAVLPLKATSGTVVGICMLLFNDTAGNSYEQSFCIFRLNTGALANCDKYNDLKRLH